MTTGAAKIAVGGAVVVVGVVSGPMTDAWAVKVAGVGAMTMDVGLVVPANAMTMIVEVVGVGLGALTMVGLNAMAMVVGVPVVGVGVGAMTTLVGVAGVGAMTMVAGVAGVGVLVIENSLAHSGWRLEYPSL